MTKTKNPPSVRLWLAAALVLMWASDARADFSMMSSTPVEVCLIGMLLIAGWACAMTALELWHAKWPAWVLALFAALIAGIMSAYYFADATLPWYVTLRAVLFTVGLVLAIADPTLRRSGVDLWTAD